MNDFMKFVESYPSYISLICIYDHFSFARVFFEALCFNFLSVSLFHFLFDFFHILSAYKYVVINFND